jgi:ATP-dependent helicase/nuclease subunit A
MSDHTGQRDWTRPQHDAITTVDKNLLVSAAAGSGKTSVLAERCVYLVCDAQALCDVDDLLVVTFTDAAAAQMKSRIAESLRRRAECSPSDRLTRQLALIDHAQVSTLHGFCARVLRQNFHLAGIDPAFRILDGEEAGLLRRETAREVLQDSYETGDTIAFQAFLDAYCEGDDQRLVKLIVKTHEMLCSLIDPNKWMRDARLRISQALQGKLEDSELGTELHDWITRELAAVRAQCDAGPGLLRKLGRFSAYERDISENLLPTIRDWQNIFASDGLDALAEMISVDLPRLPSVPNSVENKEAAKSVVDTIRNQMKKGEWREALRFTATQWQQGLADIFPHAKTFLDLIGQFARRYRNAKDADRTLDFADLERLSLRILSDKGKPSATAQAYQRRFSHVLVDEYQDINELQDEILSLVSHERAATQAEMRANLFCVGDVKQSIYRFRLAEPARFLDRERKLRGGGSCGAVIDLQMNFRSRGPLLNAINGVFERMMTVEAADISYDKSHRLVAGQTFPPDEGARSFRGAPIELHLVAKVQDNDDSETEDEDGSEPDRTEREAILIARRIRQLMGKEAGTQAMLVADSGPNDSKILRPIRFSDVVILLRTMRFKAEQFARILGDEGIPVHADSVTGYFESMEVRDLLALLQVLDNQQQDIPLATLLRSPLAGLPEPEDAMARIRVAYPPDAKGDVPFHQAVVRYSREKEDELAAHLRDLLQTVQQWRDTAQRRPLDELLWNIYQQTGFLAFCEGLSNGTQRVANLMLLREKATQFGTFGRQGLARYLELLESLRDEADLGLPSTATAAQDVVRIMSVHRSKGLEFPVVFLPDLGKGINLDDSRGQILADRKLGLGLCVVDQTRFVRYPSLASTLVKNRLRQQSMAEELRVLYVAMTRAREHLVLVGTASDKALDYCTTRWAGHQGSFPADCILGAGSMLTWVASVAAATNMATPPIFQTYRYPAEEVATWRSAASSRTKFTPEQLAIARLEPLKTFQGSTPGSQRIIAQLDWRYRFEQFTKVPAAQSVTGHVEAPDGEGIPRRNPHGSSLERALERPDFLVEQTAFSATERGTATHLVLQHLDFSHACDAADLERQITGMIARRAISQTEAGEVDRAALVWFLLESEIGKLLRRHAEEIRREIPVYFTLESQGVDPADQPMIRGRLDLLLPLEDGHVIVDYKTDKVDDSTVALRAEEYRPQMTLYRQAIQRITRRPVREIHLVFLAARTVVTLEN